MQTLELPLYPTLEPQPRINPIPEKVIPIRQPEENYINPQVLIENTLSSILTQHPEESNILKTRKILGETAKTLSDERIECIVSEFQFLIDSWLDEYEKDVFNGMTLKEVLNEG